MGLLVAEGFSDPFATMFKAMAYNFYPILALILVLVIIFSKKDFGPMVKAEKRVRETGKLLNDNSKPMVSDELTEVETAEGVTPKAFNAYGSIARAKGFLQVASSPLTRSSYHAGDDFAAMRKAREEKLRKKDRLTI